VPSDIADSVPENSVGFTAVSFDLVEIWKGMSSSLPAPVQQQVRAFEQNLKMSLVDDVLAKIGNTIVFSQVAAPGREKPSVLMSLALADGGGLLATLDKLTPMVPVPLNFQPGPGGAKLLTLPGNGSNGGLAITDHGLLASDDRSLLDAALGGRGGVPAGSAAHRVIERFGGRASVLSWCSGESMSQSPEARKVLDLALRQGGSDGLGEIVGAFPWLDMGAALGDVVLAVTPEKTGLRCMSESDCGFLPFAMIAAALEVESRQAKQVRSVIDSLVVRIRAAQQSYREQHGKYAGSLYDLERSGVIDRSFARGVDGSIVYRVVEEGRDWRLEVKHSSGSRRFVVDAQGTILSNQ
ncbi:MAG: hypothetical protein KDC38_20065, partial [Planctomycetes bacterium]|nr:hypothetical protein [Planctomycetota bacterium]